MADPVAAVRTGVDEGVDRAVALADHEHLVVAHPRDDEVPRLGDLGLVGNKDPAAREDTLELELIERRVGEDAPVEPALFLVEELVDLGHSPTSTTIWPSSTS